MNYIVILAIILHPIHDTLFQKYIHGHYPLGMTYNIDSVCVLIAPSKGVTLPEAYILNNMAAGLLCAF